MTKPVRVGVIGTGMMGNFHLKTYSELKEAELIGVFDIDENRAKGKASEYGCKAFSDLNVLASEVEAVSIVTPSITHAEVGNTFLNKGIHCLIEKPLATTREDCLSLIATAKKNNTTLLVGHIERYNPAITKLAEVLEQEKPTVYSLATKRMSTAGARITDVDVTLDIMIHDIEVIQSLIKSPVLSIQADGFKDGHDESCALLKFANGAYANLTVSRITKDKIRTLDIIADCGHFSLDYISQTLNLHTDVSEAKEFEVIKGLPLSIELSHFINCVKGTETPKVSGEDALSALDIAWQIQNVLKSK